MRWPRSLQGRLLAQGLAGLALVWSVVVAWTWVDAGHELEELLDAHLAQAAALLVARQLDDLDDVDRRHAGAPALHRYAPKVAFQVLHDGDLVMRSADAPAVPLAGQALLQGGGFDTVRVAGTRWRVFAARGAERDMQVLVGEQMDSRAAITRAVLRGLLWPMLLALPILALSGWWVVRAGMGPLRRLGQTLRQRHALATEAVDAPGAPSEMHPLLDALNALLLRLRGLLDAERRFTADAAHELRTPIAAIRAQAQVALGEVDDARRREALHATLRGCDRASRLVEQLLTLARLEAGAAPATSVVDLAAIARQVIADLAPTALRRAQQVALDAPGAAPVHADPVLLGVLVRNLVDNAVRYGPPGSDAEVRVAAVAGGAELTVADSGPGLGAEAQARLGERFFRELGSDAEGSGLGWSIVRRIAAHQGAEVRIGPREDRRSGLVVTVRWPPATGAT